MKVLGVIPARWGSTRLPGKSLIPIRGKPLIQWVYERACATKRLDGIVVATDDDRIFGEVLRFGGRAVMTRADHVSGTDRVAEAVAGDNAEVVINIQGDEPLIEPALIDALSDVMKGDGRADMATGATLIREEEELRNPSVVKVVRDQEGWALYFSRLPIPFQRDGIFRKGSRLHWRHIGIYAYRREFLDRFVAAPPCALEIAERLEQLRALHLGARIRVVETEYAGIGVDTPDDLLRVEALLGSQ